MHGRIHVIDCIAMPVEDGVDLVEPFSLASFLPSLSVALKLFALMVINTSH